ncbi:Intracellular distribution of mitochondria [Gaertneriomyces sp. JEL0708]|nr:Intracellular distribution of mitochondria [Gaertneriomyces sp. JEL0708]
MSIDDQTVATSADNTTAPVKEQDGTVEQQSPAAAAEEIVQGAVEDQTFNLKMLLPAGGKVDLIVSIHTSLQEIRQALYDQTATQGLTCFYFSFNGERLNDLLELAEIKGFSIDSEIRIMEGEYNDRELRIHLIRLREHLTAYGLQVGMELGVDAGATYLESVIDGEESAVVEVEKKRHKGRGAKQNAKPDIEERNPFDDFEFEKAVEALEDLAPKRFGSQKFIQCLKSMTPSHWNQPSVSQRTAGDLLYLRVETLEGETLHVTCSTSGFFVSQSTDTVFNPAPRLKKSYHEHNLATMLSKASPLFATRFEALQVNLALRNPLGYIGVPLAHTAYPFVTKPKPHVADSSRTLDQYLISADHAEAFGGRDWNEDFQATRELPRGTPRECVMRDSALCKIHTDFVDAAVRGAVQVMQGSVPPLNPLEDSGITMYLYNNIFYSLGFDKREMFESVGGEAAHHVSVSKDVDGVRLLSNMGASDIFTLGTVVIDYLGRRIVAQTVIPGILRRREDGDNLVKYGSVDGGKEVTSDQAFHTALEPIAKKLYLEEHTVKDAKGVEHKLWTSLETKGILGADNRKYLLDLYRITPVDIEFLDQVDAEVKEGMKPYLHRMVLLRPELLENYYERKLRGIVEEERKKLQENSKEAEKDGAEATAQDATTEGSTETEPAVTGSEDESAIDAAMRNFHLAFNPDVFTTAPLADADAVREAQENGTRSVSSFVNATLNRLSVEFVLHTSPMDGESLTKRMHQRGVNMRYLGKLAQIAANADEDVAEQGTPFPSKFLVQLCQQEMVARATKHILRRLMKESPAWALNEIVAHVLTCLFAEDGQEVKAEKNALHKRLAAGKVLSYTSLTPDELHRLIREEVETRYRYKNLPADFYKQRRVPLLRSICLKVGLQLLAKDYFTPSFQSIAAADVLSHYPIIKTAEPNASFAEDALAHGSLTLSSSLIPVEDVNTSESQATLELLGEAVGLFEQTVGPIHPETARAYSQLALCHYHRREYEDAVFYQKKAVMVMERTLGVDSEAVINAWLSLACYEWIDSRTLLEDDNDEPTREADGNSSSASPKPTNAKTTLTLEQRAEYFHATRRRLLRQLHHIALLHSKLTSLTPYLDGASTLSNIAQVLSRVSPSHALLFFQRARDIHLDLLGPKHGYTASSNELLARGYYSAGEFRQAVDVQRSYCAWLRERYGDTDDRTKEGEAFLKGLAGLAVGEERRKRMESDGSSSGGITLSNGAPLLASNGAPASFLHSKLRPTNGVHNSVTPTSGNAVVGTLESAKKKEKLDMSNAGVKGHLPIDEILAFLGEPTTKTSTSSASLSTVGGKTRPRPSASTTTTTPTTTNSDAAVVGDAEIPAGTALSEGTRKKKNKKKTKK